MKLFVKLPILVLLIVWGSTKVVNADERCIYAPNAIMTKNVSGDTFLNSKTIIFSGSSSTTGDCQPMAQYQWYIDGVLITGANSSSYTYTFTLSSGFEQTFVVKLKVTNHIPLSDEVTMNITIKKPKRVYHVRDHLGSVRTSVDETGTAVGYDDYYPFGLVMDGRSSNASNQNDNYKFTGYEKDVEAGLDLYHANARGFDPVLGRFMQIDPLSDLFAGWTPYHYTHNNPLNLIDPTGMFSTHTDEEGNVVSVYDDGDLGVYSHSGSASEIKKKTDACNAEGNTSCGGTDQGETEYWDEFALHDNNSGQVLYGENGNVLVDGKIYFGTSWDGVISGMNEIAMDLGGKESAGLSTSGQLFDIKSSTEHSPDGAGTGRLLNGKYASARSAGNYLAGLNGATTSQFGYTLTKRDFLKVAGAVHRRKYEGVNTVLKVLLYGKSYGKPPYYGEIPYAGRMIVNGYDNGRNKK